MTAMKELLQRVSAATLDLLYPPSCPVCKELTAESDLLCGACQQQLQFVEKPYCTCCGKGFPGEGEIHLCGHCLQSPWAFRSARGLFHYEEVIAALIHKLKYSGELSGLPALFQLCQQSQIMPAGDSYDYILPVPLHIERLRQRGFNQSLVLARTLFAPWQDKIRFDFLLRQTATSSQAGLTGIERRKNVKGAFHVPDTAQIEGCNLLLFDDVFTTGTTVNECAKVLMAAGAGSVDVLAVCRADKLFG